MPIPEIEQALAKFKVGEPAEAIPILEELVDLIPTYVMAYVLLAQAYEATQQEGKAVAAWEQAYRVIPGSPAMPAGAFGDYASDAPIPFAPEQIPYEAPPPTDPPPADPPPADLPPADPPPRPAVDFDGLDMMTDLDLFAQDPPPPSAGYVRREVFEAPPAAPRAAAAPSVKAAPPEPPAPAIAPEKAISLRAVSLIKRYKKRSVVKAVSLTVRQGEIVGLLGPNGAGKTTTFYMIVGLVRPDKGQVFLGDQDLTREPMYGRARRGIGYLAQEASIFAQMTVEDNLHAVLEYQPLSRADRKVRVDELITEFRLETVRRSKGYMLSGGERRRTEIARALASKPAFFLLDEPFAGVDPIAVEDIQSIVAGLKKRGIGVLITDHNVHETLAITDRAYLLYEGKILKQGTAEALAADPEVRKRYLGEKFTLERYQG